MVINVIAKRQIEVIKEKCEHIKPLVVIWCATYNHASYISSALDGFISQETKFPFVVIVHDDASSDSTSTIVLNYAKKHPNVIIPIIEKENQYSNGGWEEIMKEAIDATAAKYVAFCEGDDYWIDPNKLQIQVDFLENNPDYGMIYGKSLPYFQDNKKFGKAFGGEAENNFKDVVEENHIPTQSVVFRRNLLELYGKEIGTHANWKMGDYPIYLWMAFNSKIMFLPTVLSVYRILPKSASHFSKYTDWIDFRINAFEISLFFTDKYDKQLSIIPKKKIATYQYEKAILQKKGIKEAYQQLKDLGCLPSSRKERIMFSCYKVPYVYSFLFSLNSFLKKIRLK